MSGTTPLGRLRAPSDTKFSLDGCYASALGDCSRKLSREHFVSRAILERFASVAVEGLPGVPTHERRTVRAETLATRILCTHHNGVLSPLDAVGARFFSLLDQMRSPLAEPVGTQHLLLAGRDVERFLLKMGVGFASSGMLRKVSDGSRVHWRPPRRWLELLFDGSDWPPGTGLYLAGSARQRFVQRRAVGVEPVCVHGHEQIAGFEISIVGLKLLLAVEHPPKAGRGSAYADLYPHPSFMFQGRGLIELKWPRGTVTATAHLTTIGSGG